MFVGRPDVYHVGQGKRASEKSGSRSFVAPQPASGSGERGERDHGDGRGRGRDYLLEGQYVLF